MVKGKVPCDEWLITENMFYKAISKKPFRLIVSSKEEGSKEIANPYHLHDVQVLSDEQISILQEYGKRIENGYEKPMDIEFVVKNNKIFIVQVRPAQFKAISDPNFIDQASVPSSATVIAAKTFLAGSNQVLSLKGKNICYAETLEEADNIFDDTVHQAVFIYQQPQSKNSHAEVNFSSKSKPIPCLVLSEKEWHTCQRLIEKNSHLNLCPQTGKIVIIKTILPVRSGLFIHPAHFSFSAGQTGKGIHGTSQSPILNHLRQQLNNTPEELNVNLDTIYNQLNTFFSEIVVRKGNIESLAHVTEKIKNIAFKIFAEMKKSAEKNHFISLSLHASMLKHLIDQDDSMIIASHSLSGIETETNIPENIERFIEEHKKSKHLCELALLSNKAFDSLEQNAWLSFIRIHSGESKEQWQQLYVYLKHLDELNILSVWFALHFKDQQPDFNQLINIDELVIGYLAQCQTFDQKFSQLTNEIQKATRAKQLDQAFNDLIVVTDELINFGLKNAKKDILEQVKYSKLLVDLINLWDINIKAVRTSKAYSSEEAKVFKDRIDQFADFGIKLCKSQLIKMPFFDELLELIRLIRSKNIEKTTVKNPSFNVAQWIVPQGHGNGGKIKSNDQRLTILHQNLLQAVFLDSSQIDHLLPQALSKALTSFKKCGNERYAKRFGNETGCFISLTDECAKVKINVPLNLHSFVLEMSQKKGNNDIEISCFWRASDNDRTRYLDGLKVLSRLAGLTLKSFAIMKSDLRVDFISKSDKDLTWINRAIQITISDVLGTDDFFKSLVWSIQKLESTKEVEVNKETAEERVISCLMQQYLEEGTLPNFIDEDRLEKYFSNHPVPTAVIEKVEERLKTKKIGYYSAEKKLLLSILKALSKEKQIQLIWDDLNGGQSIDPNVIEECGHLDLLQKFIHENPKKAMVFYQEYSYCGCLEPIFADFIDSNLSNFIKNNVYITFEGIKKKQLEKLNEEDLKKIIWADLKRDQCIPPKEYPLGAFDMFRKLFKENRIAAINFFKKNMFKVPEIVYTIAEENNLTREELWVS